MIKDWVDPFTDEKSLRDAFKEVEELQRQCYRDGDVILFPEAGGYKVALARCDTPEKILDWVSHLCDKSWMTTGLIQRFIEIVCEAHGIEYLDIT